MPLIETRGAASAQGFGEFAQSTAVNYIEDVFSTYLYTGNGSTQTITNGIDVSGKGGFVWLKQRDGTWGNYVYDTSRGAGYSLLTNSNSAQAGLDTSKLSAFGTTGFSVGNSLTVNGSGSTYASWTFRKQAKFFDVVTYTGNATSGRAIAHSLGSTPGCVIVKCTTNTYDWMVYHRSLPSSSYFLKLNTTDAQANVSSIWSTTAPTATDFYVGSDGSTNGSGETYVAYIFAHDAGGFGLSGSDNVISCGSFTTDGSGNATVTLGYEPQWFLRKRTDSTGNWTVVDNMRGFTAGGTDAFLYPNLSNAEATSGGSERLTSTGVQITGFAASMTFIYIAIRRGPMKVPTSGTSVFSPNKTNASSGTIVTTDVNSDLFVVKYLDGVDIPRWHDRLRGYANNVGDASPLLRSSGTDAELTGATGAIASVTNTGFKVTGTLGGLNSVYYSFRRAPGFFDVVCYTGTGSATTQAHNLGVVPELMIVKKRSAADAWVVYANNDNTDYLVLNTTAATVDDNTIWNDTSPTSSVFTVGTNDDVNGNTATFVAYLFATVAGVSKVGTYTGTGTTKQIDCGFTGGARFVLIKRTDSTGDWYVWDSARGIVASTDPYLLLNSTAAEVTNTDYVDTYSAGFELSSTAPAALNANGGSFIFFAVA